ncbi:hypothetical protein H4219_004427 [Mycoemilia scoparia]|uniref:Uncharacterized protein n=1 Tax=Mycoemilia scoparia TaxID=417184 RepID=A0A9W7ZYB5_9FUNG|nr:hypothetical protein H4219_004427 [Mycoemilia scoparia]
MLPKQLLAAGLVLALSARALPAGPEYTPRHTSKVHHSKNLDFDDDDDDYFQDPHSVIRALQAGAEYTPRHTSKIHHSKNLDFDDDDDDYFQDPHSVIRAFQTGSGHRPRHTSKIHHSKNLDFDDDDSKDSHSGIKEVISSIHDKVASDISKGFSAMDIFHIMHPEGPGDGEEVEDDDDAAEPTGADEGDDDDDAEPTGADEENHDDEDDDEDEDKN